MQTGKVSFGLKKKKKLREREKISIFEFEIFSVARFFFARDILEFRFRDAKKAKPLEQKKCLRE